MSELTQVPRHCIECHRDLGHSFNLVNGTVKEGRKKFTTLVGPLCDDCANKRRKNPEVMP